MKYQFKLITAENKSRGYKCTKCRKTRLINIYKNEDQDDTKNSWLCRECYKKLINGASGDGVYPYWKVFRVDEHNNINEIEILNCSSFQDAIDITAQGHLINNDPRFICPYNPDSSILATSKEYLEYLLKFDYEVA
jgi:hypothetical protein